MIIDNYYSLVYNIDIIINYIDAHCPLLRVLLGRVPVLHCCQLREIVEILRGLHTHGNRSMLDGLAETSNAQEGINIQGNIIDM